MTNTITITGTTYGLNVRSNQFDTQEEADAFVALFPKSYNFKSYPHTTTRDDTDDEWYTCFVVRANATLTADAVNGGKNETGIARIAKIAAKSEKLGVDVVIEQGRHTNAFTVEQIEEMIS